MFKWKYTPSIDLDSVVPNPDDNEGEEVVIISFQSDTPWHACIKQLNLSIPWSKISLSLKISLVKEKT